MQQFQGFRPPGSRPPGFRPPGPGFRPPGPGFRPPFRPLPPGGFGPNDRFGGLGLGLGLISGLALGGLFNPNTVFVPSYPFPTPFPAPFQAPYPYPYPYPYYYPRPIITT